MLTLFSASFFISSHFITYHINLELGINCMNNTDNNNAIPPIPWLFCWFGYLDMKSLFIESNITLADFHTNFYDISSPTFTFTHVGEWGLLTTKSLLCQDFLSPQLARNCLKCDKLQWGVFGDLVVCRLSQCYHIIIFVVVISLVNPRLTAHWTIRYICLGLWYS